MKNQTKKNNARPDALIVGLQPGTTVRKHRWKHGRGLQTGQQNRRA
ncbi:MAG: hypothetical protein AAFZ15_06735 [Bacteroidota bacterium]